MEKLEIIKLLDEIIVLSGQSDNHYVFSKSIKVKSILINMWNEENFHYQELLKKINAHEENI
jgi:hypothetical protein